MVIQHKQGQHGMFYMENDGEMQAEMTYFMKGSDTMIIEHTEVSVELRGQNVGFKLVHAAVDFARHHQIKIIPACPFARSVFDKKPDWKDVLLS
mgnify:CR=1 FL=1